MNFMNLAFLITCEHAVNAVPPDLAPLFRGAEEVLASHRGWDPGALDAARVWAEYFHAPLFAAKVSRLVCDANRNERNPAVWSVRTRPLPRSERERLLNQWHRPHRRVVTDEISRLVATGRTVLHLAAHSFTPELDGAVRALDMGLLYDPARPGERALAQVWQRALVSSRSAAPACPPETEVAGRNPSPRRHTGRSPAGLSSLRVRRNAPYRGVSDGLPTALRRLFPAGRYLGFEVEFNQALLACGPFPAAVAAEALETALDRF